MLATTPIFPPVSPVCATEERGHAQLIAIDPALLSLAHTPSEATSPVARPVTPNPPVVPEMLGGLSEPIDMAFTHQRFRNLG